MLGALGATGCKLKGKMMGHTSTDKDAPSMGSASPEVRALFERLLHADNTIVLLRLEVELLRESRPTWLPIKTAPKDETPMLLTWVGMSDCIIGEWSKYGKRWIQSDVDDAAWCFIFTGPPTHWMPLPKPPEAK